MYYKDFRANLSNNYSAREHFIRLGHSFFASEITIPMFHFFAEATQIFAEHAAANTSFMAIVTKIYYRNTSLIMSDVALVCDLLGHLISCGYCRCFSMQYICILIQETSSFNATHDEL